MRQNYEKEMEDTIARLEREGKTPTILLHSCCAPCSSAVLERLTPHFRVTVFYYNPNIDPPAEYQKRVREQRRFLDVCRTVTPAEMIEGPYEPEEYDRIARGMEAEPEGGARCMRCYALRLRRTAERARADGFDYFTTTLSVSPYKNARALNEIGGRLAAEYGVPYLYSDFKKKDGYLRSIRLSGEYGLYRQNFCGCRYSRLAREAECAAKENNSAEQP